MQLYYICVLVEPVCVIIRNTICVLRFLVGLKIIFAFVHKYSIWKLSQSEQVGRVIFDHAKRAALNFH